MKGEARDRAARARARREAAWRAIDGRHDGALRLTGLSSQRLAEIGRECPEQPGRDYQRPRTRGECEAGPRPCPYASCEYHLYLEISKGGAVRVSWPNAEPGDLAESCALDVAARGGATLQQVAEILNCTRERVRQIEEDALIHLRLRGVDL